jgi:predicted kinase
VVGGLPGTGKSTLAAAIADTKGWTVLRSDEVRKELAELRPADRPGDAYGEGIYSPSATEATYRELLRRARVGLGLGETVVLDASWTDSRWRNSASDIAKATAAELVEIRCTAPPPVASARLVERVQGGADPSDANPDVAKLMAADADPWPTAIDVDTTGSGGESLARALAHLD